MAAPVAHVAAGDFATGAATVNGNTLTVGKPTNTADGDKLVALLYNNHSSGDFSSVPAGWHATPTSPAFPGVGCFRAYYLDVGAAADGAASGLPSSWGWGISTNTRWVGVIYRITGAAIGPPAHNGTEVTGGGTNITIASTSNDANSLLTAHWMSTSSTSATPAVGATPSGMTQGPTAQAVIGTTNSWLSMAYQTLASAGSSGTKTSAWSGGTEENSNGQLFSWSAPVAAVAPVANAGPDQTVEPYTNVTLDGTGSSFTAPDTAVSYAWTQIAGAAVTLFGSTAAQPTFVMPPSVSGTTRTFSLTVTGNSTGLPSVAADTVSITDLPHTRWRIESGDPTPVRLTKL